MNLADLPLNEIQELRQGPGDSPWLALRQDSGVVLRSPALGLPIDTASCALALESGLHGLLEPHARLVIDGGGQLCLEGFHAGAALSQDLEGLLQQEAVRVEMITQGLLQGQAAARDGSATAEGQGDQSGVEAATPEGWVDLDAEPDSIDEEEEQASGRPELLEIIMQAVADDDELAACAEVDDPPTGVEISSPDEDWLLWIGPSARGQWVSAVFPLMQMQAGHENELEATLRQMLSLNSMAATGPDVQIALDMSTTTLLLLSEFPADELSAEALKTCLGRMLALQEELMAYLALPQGSPPGIALDGPLPAGALRG